MKIDIKALRMTLAILVLIVGSTVSVMTFFETKEDANKKYAEMNAKLVSYELKSKRIDAILCATAIELKWPTVQKACGLN